jgi:hypothetical protein
MSYRPTWRERLEDAKRYQGPALAAAIVVLTAGWALWWQFGRSGPGPADARVERQIGPVARAKADEVARLEAEYRQALAVKAGDELAEPLLGRLIAAQQELLRLEPRLGAGEAVRLGQWEAARSALRSRAAARKSADLESAAAQAEARGETAAATARLREALQWQREANSQAPTSDLKNMNREIRLAAAVAQVSAEPLRAAVAAALADGAAAAAAGRQGEATLAFRKARLLQAEINEKHSGGRSADTAMLERIDGELETLRAGELAKDQKAREEAADAEAAAGRADAAAAGYVQAMELQRKLNSAYPRSRYATPERIEQLLVKRETALSAAGWAALAALEREIALRLQLRQPGPAAERIAEAMELLRKTAAAYPRSTRADPRLQKRLEFLAVRRGDLAALQGFVYSRTAPIPGFPQRLMLKTEVPQEFFLRVISGNPSRHEGRRLPVDSVGWTEVQEFCERLGWALGTKVRLPRELEFKAAAAPAPATVWTQANADNRSQETGSAPANAAGFHELHGNLAEWLEPAPDAPQVSAPLGGGSFLEPEAKVRELPVVTVNRRERGRHIGFRFVVELPNP